MEWMLWIFDSSENVSRNFVSMTNVRNQTCNGEVSEHV